MVDEQWWRCVTDAVFELDKRTQEEIWNVFQEDALETLDQMQTFVNECDSPIEKVLSVHLLHQCNAYEKVFDGIALHAQYGVSANGNNYRADFMVNCIHKQAIVKVAVECDGHDFHEKTKRQAARDKKRDRDFHLAGISVLRFTGSEIWENPNRCAKDVFKFLVEEVSRRQTVGASNG